MVARKKLSLTTRELMSHRYRQRQFSNVLKGLTWPYILKASGAFLSCPSWGPRLTVTSLRNVISPINLLCIYLYCVYGRAYVCTIDYIYQKITFQNDKACFCTSFPESSRINYSLSKVLKNKATKCYSPTFLLYCFFFPFYYISILQKSKAVTVLHGFYLKYIFNNIISCLFTSFTLTFRCLVWFILYQNIIFFLLYFT